MPFTTSSLAKARAYADRLQKRIASVRENTEEAIGHGMEVAEVSAAAFAFGYANGRWARPGEDLKVLGIPADLAAGFGLTGLALLGGFGKYSEHGVNIGAGALAAFGYRSGLELGAQASANASGARPTSYSGTYYAPPPDPPIVTSGEPVYDGVEYVVHEPIAR